MLIDPNSLPRVEPLDPASVFVTEQKLTGRLTYKTVGTGSLSSPGTQGASYGTGSEPEIID